MNQLKDYDTLTIQGNISFYQSCEVTELFLIYKQDRKVYNLFTIAVFEEKPFEGNNPCYLGNRIVYNSEFSIGLKRFWLSMESARASFEELLTNNKWRSVEDSGSQVHALNPLPKQYIPSKGDNRINRVLKNNFHGGSYILEFFDEEKSNLNFLLDMNAVEKFNTLFEKVKELVSIDLSVVRDRVGNIIFQFPVSLLEMKSKAKPLRDGVELRFTWHPLLKVLPDCHLHIESVMDKNLMGSKIEEYNKGNYQVVETGNIELISTIRVWRKDPSLILFTFQGSYLSGVMLGINFVNPEPRQFELNGTLIEIEVNNLTVPPPNSKMEYSIYIANNLYDEEKKQLEKSLAFKQYRHVNHDLALKDLRTLISRYDRNGVFLWDPFLRADDILETLYFSGSEGVELRAIGSSNKSTAVIYENRGQEPRQIIAEERLVLENPAHINTGLNLEFRFQYGLFGWKFHDRFLIFPGSKQFRPRVYALGTSVNSFGNEHNILQEVSHPQPVVDAFNELWQELNHPECLVWKWPK